MKNNVKIVNLITAVSMICSSTHVYAIDLNTKIQNTDKSDFNTINSPFRSKNKKNSLSFEYSNTKNPMVLKRSDGTTVTLIEGLSVMELSMLYGITDSLQLGILVPNENPYGIVAPYNEAKNYLGNILIEPKLYILDNVAFIPLYYIPGSNKVANFYNSGNDLTLGKDKGGYGAKLSMGFGDKENPESILTAIQIGAIMAPESKFKLNQNSTEIDQSSRFQFGVGISYPVSGSLRLLLEAYGEKTKNNTPMESIATIEYKNDNFMMRLGGGTGDLQGSGSNTAKVLANFTYYFGSEKETAKTTIRPAAPSERFDDRIKEIKRKDNNEPLFQNEPMEEQNEPSSGQLPFGGIVRNDLMIEPRRIPINTAKIPVPKQKPVPEPDNHVFVLVDRKRSKDDFFLIGEDDNDDTSRMPASESSTLTEEEIILKAKENIKNAIKLIDNNLYLHQKAEAKNDKEEMKKLETELRWGLRVYNKNIKTVNSLVKTETTLDYNSKVEEARNILDGRPSGQKLEFFVINTNRVLVKTSENTDTKDNTLTHLSQNDEVVVLGTLAYGEYVQIKMTKGRFEQYEYPMFVNKKYLSKKEENSVLAKDEPKKEIESPVVEEQQVEEVLSAEEVADIQKQLDEIEQILEQRIQEQYSVETEGVAPADVMIVEEKKEEPAPEQQLQKAVEQVKAKEAEEVVVEVPKQEQKTEETIVPTPVVEAVEVTPEVPVMLAPVVIEEPTKEVEQTPVVKEEPKLELKEEVQLTVEQSNEIKEEIKEEVKKVVDENPPVELKVQPTVIDEKVIENKQEIIVDEELDKSLEEPVVETKQEETIVPTPVVESVESTPEVPVMVAPVVEEKVEPVVTEESKEDVVQEVTPTTPEMLAPVEAKATPIVETPKQEEAKSLQEVLVDKPLTIDTIVEQIKVQENVVVEEVKEEKKEEQVAEEVKNLSQEPVVNHLEEEKAKFRAILNEELDKTSGTVKKAEPVDELSQLVNEAEESTSARSIKATERDLPKELPEKVINPEGSSMGEIRKDLPTQDINQELETVVIESKEKENKLEGFKSEETLNAQPVVAPTAVEIQDQQDESVRENPVVESSQPQENKAAAKEEVKTPVELVEEKAEIKSVETTVAPNKVEIVTEEEKTSMKDLLLKDVVEEKAAQKVEIVTEKEQVSEQELSKLADKKALEEQVKKEKEQQEKKLLADKIEKERLEALKKKEMEQIDQYLELKAQSKKDVKTKDTKPLKEVATEDVKKVEEGSTKEQSPFKELLKKSKETGDSLKEEDDIEEQNGPSFGEI